jgi:hypothetical protein
MKTKNAITSTFFASSISATSVLPERAVSSNGVQPLLALALTSASLASSDSSLLAACETAESRLTKASHQNAKALYQVISAALESMHEKTLKFEDE